MSRKPKTLEERFWNKVRKTKTCWLFESTHGGMEYGLLSRSKLTIGRERLAHRLSWEIHYGPIPDGMRVLHRCDTPKCVNPEHLFLGTSQDNMDDMVAKGRSMAGEKHPKAKLTDSDVRLIRRAYARGNVSQQKLADRFGVNQTLIGFIVRRVTWKHV